MLALLRRSTACLLALLLAVAAAQASAPRPAWADGVYYEVFVRSFQDSDGDGVGDLPGLTSRLDYLADLGVTGVWLTPIHPSPSYHGYDVTDYRAVHPDLGTLDDFDAFVSAAHERGIRVVLDLVVNHTSDRHPWFEAARAGDPAYRDWYVWRDAPPDWRGLGGGPAWHPADGSWYLGLFWSGMPDLNYRTPAVRRAMEDAARFWLERGVDGFRIDAIQHVVESEAGEIRTTPETLAWVGEFEAFLHDVAPDAFLVGETWTAPPTIASYFAAGLDMAFDYPRWGALLDAVQSRGATDLAAELAQEASLYPDGAALGTFLANHDQVRPATRLSPLRPDPKRLALAAGLLLTLPGTPFLYYGEEIGLPNGPGDADEEKRTPMRWEPGPGAGFTDGAPWYPFSTDADAVTVAAQADDPDSLFATYRALIALRAAHPALAAGALEVLDVPGAPRSLLAFAREGGGERVVVIANLGAGETEVALAPLGLDAARDLLGGGEAVGSVTLPGTSLLVLGAR